MNDAFDRAWFFLKASMQAPPPEDDDWDEERSLYWDKFDMYVVNTTKSHTLVNLSPTKDSIWLVINAEVCNEMINFVENNLTEQ